MPYPHFTFTLFSAEAWQACLSSACILVTDFGFLGQISLWLKLDLNCILLVQDSKRSVFFSIQHNKGTLQLC